MTHELKPLPTEEKISAKEAQQLRNASRIATIILGAAAVVTVFYLFLAWQLGAWQMYALAGEIAAFMALNFFARRMIRGGRIETGSWMIVIGMLVVFPVATLLVSDVGILFGLIVVILTFVVANQTLPAKSARLALFVSVGVGIVTAALDLLNLEYRLFAPVIQTFIPAVAVAIVLAAGFFIVRRAWRGNLASRLTTSFILVAAVPLLLVGAIISFQSYTTLRSQALGVQSQTAKRVAEQVENFILERESELSAFSNLGFLDTLSTEELQSTLLRLFSSNNLYNEIVLVDGRGQEQIYLSAVKTVAPQDMGSRAGTEAFEQPKATGETYYSSVQFDELTGEPFMVISLPIFDLRTGELQYALIANFRFKTVWELMAQADVAGNGIVYMIEHDGQVIAHANPSVVLGGTILNNPPEEDLFRAGLDGTDVAMSRSHVEVGTQDFDVIAEQPESEAIALATSNLTTAVIATLVAIALASFVGTFISRLITTPIGALADSAEQLAAGNLSVRAEVGREDEIGTLATGFNEMAGQLQETLQGLEQRVADRTKALATSAEVSRRLTTILDPGQLVGEVVNEVRAAFDYYYAQIYLLDEAGENLVIAGGTGEAGASMMARRHSLPKGRGLVGRAADANASVLVPDTTQEEGWLPNELLPETKAEAAIPIAIGSQVLGVLDVQHSLVNGLTADDVVLLESLAGQVAITLQNARSYEESRRQAEMESLVNVIGQKIQRATTMEETLQTAIRELGTAIGASRVRAKLAPAASAVATEPVPSAEPAVAIAEGDGQSNNDNSNAQVA